VEEQIHKQLKCADWTTRRLGSFRLDNLQTTLVTHRLSMHRHLQSN